MLDGFRTYQLALSLYHGCEAVQVPTIYVISFFVLL